MALVYAKVTPATIYSLYEAQTFKNANILIVFNNAELVEIEQLDESYFKVITTEGAYTVHGLITAAIVNTEGM